MNKKPKAYRQGDVLLLEVEKIPEGVQESNKVAAFGEKTGHSHSVRERVTAYAHTDSASVGLADYFEVNDAIGANLEHQEHTTINLPPSKYKIFRQVEYTPKELVRVAD